MAALIRFLNLDFHVFFTLLSRGWSVLAGALTVLFIPVFLSPIEQGYYYTFASLLGLQILFELGLGQVILQMVSREMAHLQVVNDVNLVGDSQRIDRLSSLMVMFRKWYFVAAILFILFVSTVGVYFLSQRSELPDKTWVGIWLLMVIFTAANLSFSPIFAFMEGCGEIGRVAKLRLTQTMLGYTCLWAALSFNLGLVAVCMVPMVSMAANIYWIRRFGGLYKKLICRDRKFLSEFNWSKDILPFQWRIALSAISGYFIFYVMTPFVFLNQGAVEAGRFGIGMTVFNALAMVGTSWVYARTPTMAMHVSRNERLELNILFGDVAKRSLIFTATVALMILVTTWISAMADIGIVKRISDLPVLFCLAVASVANCLIFSAAAYMRTHCEEPMTLISLTWASATLLIAYFFSNESVLLMSIAYAVVTVFLTLPWTLLVFVRYYNR